MLMSPDPHSNPPSSRALWYHVTLALGLCLGCATSGVAPVEYPAVRVYHADTGSVSAAVRQVAESLDVKLMPDSPWKKTTALYFEGHWKEQPKSVQGQKSWHTKDYMTCPRDPAGTQLSLKTGEAQNTASLSLRIQLRPVVPDSVALQMGVRAAQSEMDEGQVTWMDCESKGKFEESFLAAMDSVLGVRQSERQ
jgi:hypothetical protein